MSSWILVGFITTEPPRELLQGPSFFFFVFLSFVVVVGVVVAISWAAPAAYGGSQARG